MSWQERWLRINMMSLDFLIYVRFLCTGNHLRVSQDLNLCKMVDKNKDVHPYNLKHAWAGKIQITQLICEEWTVSLIIVFVLYVYISLLSKFTWPTNSDLWSGYFDPFTFLMIGICFRRTDFEFTGRSASGLSAYVRVFMPRHKKWRGIMLYPPNFWVSVRPSVRPSVSGWSFVSAL